jgi:putative glycosyltransferase (TIGR04348 family)
MLRPRVGIVTRALANTNNGNWRTASRWARILAPDVRVRILPLWNGEPLELLIALNAFRSADSIAAWAKSHHRSASPDAAPLLVVLTGTDLYRDIQSDARAQRSLRYADALVVLQDRGVDALPSALRPKANVIYQSGMTRRTVPKTKRHLRVLMVGHMREEKSPQTLFEAAHLLRDRGDIFIDHVGSSLEPGLARLAGSTARACPQYRWLGALSHPETLRRIQHAHVLVHTSRMEGGAHAILEAVCSGTPVIASNVSGNVGMLGSNYDGYFPWGDAHALAALLQRCRDEPRLLAQLARQCRARAPRFEPRRERQAVRRLVADLLRTGTGRQPEKNR